MTSAADREARIRALCEARDMKRAATALLRAYGREILGFLVARLRDRDAAAEVFSLFTEALWKGLPSFRWECSARVWAYAIARHAAARYARDTRRRGRRYLALSEAGPLSAIEEKVRTETFASSRTEARERAVKLRERLPIEDQTILVLRINRRLEWKDIARVMVYDGSPVTDRELQAEAARLRKRYQLAKERLRKMAIDDGIIPPRDE
jgi:RNA polymerase sigma-70 factor (ECF subfamily)